MSEKIYAKLIGDADAELLQEACSDVVYLTDQGYSPTDAIVKVASAAKFPIHKTRLLVYAYSNGVASEKRAELGGPFERLGAFVLPNVEEIEQRLYATAGLPVKEASLPAVIPMDVFQTDLAGKTKREIYDLLGMSSKTASGESDEEDSFVDDEGKPTGKGVAVKRTIISISIGRPKEEDAEESKKCECGEEECEECSKKEMPTLQEVLSRNIPEIPQDLFDDLEPVLLGLLKGKKEAMAIANQEADDAYDAMNCAIADFQRKIDNRRLEPQFKRAGLLSVRAYYPDVGDLLQSCVGEVNAHLIKLAEHSVTDITVRHPWVAEAKELDALIQTAADRTVEANRKNAEYKIVCEMYQERKQLKEQMRKEAFLGPFLAGSFTSGKNPLLRPLYGPDSEAKSKVQQDIVDALDDKFQEMKRRDIETVSMLNDFSTNDEILSAYPYDQLLQGYNDLLHTAPETMRNKPQARALLQQYMSQGRMAPMELMPALEMNRLNPRRSFSSDFNDEPS